MYLCVFAKLNKSVRITMLARLPRSPNISFHFSSHLYVVMIKTKLRLDVKLSVYLMACKVRKFLFSTLQRNDLVYDQDE